MSVGFPGAIISAWPSMSRQLGPTTVIFSGTSTCCVRMLAITDLFVECKQQLVVAKDSGTAMSSCWRMFSKCTSRPALYAVMSLCRMFLSTLIVSCLPLQGCTTSFKEENVFALFLNWWFQIQVLLTTWGLTQASGYKNLHLFMSEQFCTEERILNLWGD